MRADGSTARIGTRRSAAEWAARWRLTAVHALAWALMLQLVSGCTHTRNAHTTSSTEPASSVVTQAKTGQFGRDFIWRAKRANHVHYLLGTIHVGVDAERQLSPATWSSLRAAGCYVMESDPSLIDPRALATMGMLPPGESLEKLLPKEAWDRLVTALEPRVPRVRLARMQPWLASLLYMQATLPRGPSMDAALQRAAKAATVPKAFVYLEGWRDAISAFAEASTQADLETLLLDEGSLQRETDLLIAAYLTGDERRLSAALEASISPDAKERVEKLVTGRNLLWKSRLLSALRDEPQCFIAVGAAHLIGPESLLEMLREDGWTVTRLGRPAPESEPH